MALPVFLAPLGAFLVGAAGNIVRSALLNLGIGLITFVTVTTLLSEFIVNAKSNYSQLPSELLQLAGLAGFPESFGLITGALIMRTTLQFLPRFGRLPTGN